MRYSGGGFGGGRNDFFGDFDARSDVDVNLYWEVQNLGLADRAIARSRAAQGRAATLQLMKVQDRVAVGRGPRRQGQARRPPARWRRRPAPSPRPCAPSR